MSQFNKIASYLLIFINVLLVFLFIFEAKVSISQYIGPLGRMHPLVLHLPIGFAVCLLIFYFFKNDIESNTFNKLIQFLLNLTAISVGFTAIFGFFLLKEGGFDESNLQIHKWGGVLVGLFAYGLTVFYTRLGFHKNSSGAWALVIIMSFVGHFGANITHGDNYLFEPWLPSNAKLTFTENNSLYDVAVFPILEAKCIACHNDNKIKGELNMSTITKIMKGGKNGPIWVSGQALNSHIIQRATLPIDDKKHMPPRGKPQLTQNEIFILTQWINEGADMTKAVKDYASTSPSKTYALAMLAKEKEPKEEKIYNFSAANESEIAAANTPFCTVFPVAHQSPALEADFFVSKKFDKQSLENLTKISDQIVVLNLAKMPVNDQDLKLLSKFKNLEKLILNGTDITGSTLATLNNCKNLSSLALSSTKVKETDLLSILNQPSLKELFVWNTAITPAQMQSLTKKFPKVKIEGGYQTDKNEILKLNPPILVNEEYILKGNSTISFKHSLKDVTIRYTTDGTEPDSTTQLIYSQPIKPNEAVLVQAVATKPGWYTSQKLSQYFFKSTFIPDSAILINPANKQYLASGSTTLFDLKKGSIDNNNLHWLGYKETDFSALFEFKQEKPIKNVTLSYLRNIGSYIMPPTSVELWAGSTKSNLNLIAKNMPIPAKMGDNAAILGLNLSLPQSNYKYIKIIAKPIKKLPTWHQGKGQPGWVFVDEVFFN